MAKLTLDISMSLDGFIAGPNQTLDEPLGRCGDQLHCWAFATRAFRAQHGREGGEDNVDSEVAAESLRNRGATVMGRRMFSGGEGPWGGDPGCDLRRLGAHLAVRVPRQRTTRAVAGDRRPDPRLAGDRRRAGGLHRCGRLGIGLQL